MKMLISPLSNEMIQWMIKGYDKTLDNIDHDIHEILSYISPDIAYDDWLYVGMALHAEGYGLSIWEEWSAKGSKYKSGECSQKWNGFDGNGGISIGSLIYIAKQNGYKGKAKGSFNQTPQKTPASPFEFVHVDDLVKNIKPISWLVGGYIENHTLSMIFGDPASGKSFVAIDLSCCIATGTAWHGQDVNQGAVFYIAGEGHNGLGKRFKAWQEHNGVSLENARLHTAKRSAQLYDENSAIAVGDAVQTIIENTGHRPSLIVIDTLARNFGGGDENSTKEMNQFIANVDELKDRWNASVLIIHHSGHQEKARARGSMALKGALDHEYLCKKTGDCLTIENKKTKDGEAPPELSFKFKKTFFQTNEGTTDSAVLVPMENNVRKEIRLNKTQKRALDILRNCMIDKGKYRNVKRDMPKVNCITIDEYRDALKFANISSSDKTDSVNKAISRVMEKLNDEYITVTYGDYVWMSDKSDNSRQINFCQNAQNGQTGQLPIGMSVLSGERNEGEKE